MGKVLEEFSLSNSKRKIIFWKLNFLWKKNWDKKKNLKNFKVFRKVLKNPEIYKYHYRKCKSTLTEMLLKNYSRLHRKILHWHVELKITFATPSFLELNEKSNHKFSSLYTPNLQKPSSIHLLYMPSKSKEQKSATWTTNSMYF